MRQLLFRAARLGAVGATLADRAEADGRDSRSGGFGARRFLLVISHDLADHCGQGLAGCFDGTAFGADLFLHLGDGFEIGVSSFADGGIGLGAAEGDVLCILCSSTICSTRDTLDLRDFGGLCGFSAAVGLTLDLCNLGSLRSGSTLCSACFALYLGDSSSLGSCRALRCSIRFNLCNSSSLCSGKAGRVGR